MSPALGLLLGARASDGVMIDMASRCSEVTNDGVLLRDLEKLLENMNLKESGEDSWSWKMDSQGVFTVNKLSKLLQKRIAPPEICDFANFWNALVPSKVNLFTWRLLLNTIPTKVNLQQRGVTLTSVDCCLYGLEPEDIDHCCFRCSKIDALWRKVWGWCDMSEPRMDSLSSFKIRILHGDFQRVRSVTIRAVLMITDIALIARGEGKNSARGLVPSGSENG
ncbi:hypothetical protein OSB04_022965 [Centaurea solstitialis]|uniref:Reverse transcriptase zinc-binding domain-containing protein n=1 Tax=Centaurea solstitialis TaxID=347529 RepID=A0AA38SQR5_9ASTR|nr:hypothetical protein OSB04_022965 [Centaurea solstitialis]